MVNGIEAAPQLLTALSIYIFLGRRCQDFEWLLTTLSKYISRQKVPDQWMVLKQHLSSWQHYPYMFPCMFLGRRFMDSEWYWGNTSAPDSTIWLCTAGWSVPWYINCQGEPCIPGNMNLHEKNHPYWLGYFVC